MKISGGIKEKGVVVGNTYDKYGSRNLIVRRLMAGFDNCLSDFVYQAAPKTIHEIGCGEGYWVSKWNREGFGARGTDFSEKVIDIARSNASENGMSPEVFKVRSIYDLDEKKDSADLVVCCEVLEHLIFPEKGLTALTRIAKPYIILSVPQEPLWRVLNMMRGKYISGWGNTPGHVQHWSRKSFIRLIEEYFQVVKVMTPLPWTMALCKAVD